MNRLYINYKGIPEILNASYLPSIDGLRAISICIVILSHVLVGHGDPRLLSIFGSGHLGVLCFFVISGFLITTLILKERVNTGTISLRKFYIRRFIRIFPVAYLYLLVLLLLKFFFHLDIYVFGLLAPALYIQNLNIINNPNPYTGHYWSLSVEEQFYLIFPLLQKIAKKTYGIVLLSCLCLDLLLKYSYYHVDWAAVKFLWGLIDNIDSILIGCIIAVFLFVEIIPLQFIRKNKFILHIACVALILLPHYLKAEFLKNSIIAVAFGIILISNLMPSKDFIFRILNNRWMIKLGVLSYSLYIWQQLFMFSHFDVRIAGINVLGFPLNLLALLLVSFVSYTYFEKYFLSLRRKFK